MRGFIILLFLFPCLAFEQVILTNPVHFKVNSSTAYQLSISFEKIGEGCIYLVVSSKDKFVQVQPKQGKVYLRGDQLGNAKVVQFSSDTIVVPRAIRANTRYYFSVFVARIVEGKVQYQLNNPLIIDVLTAGLIPANYYESISVNAPNFLSQLSELINTHIELPYASYRNTVLAKLEMQDTILNKAYVECVYSGERKVFTDPFDWTELGYSREHTFAHSWMPSHPANDPPLPEYSDYHNLYPTNLDKANTVRNNFPLGEITGKLLYTYLEGRLGYNGSQIVYEPRNSHKGNAARSMFYMMVAYNGIKHHSWILPKNQDQYVLKKWHFQDPPDNYEISRQEYIYSLQGNRNPFIDHPEYACSIDFSRMMKTKGDCTNSINENENSELSIQYENHTLIISSEELITDIVFYDITGKDVYHYSPFDFHFQLDNSFGKSGVYFLEITLNSRGVVRRKIQLD